MLSCSSVMQDSVALLSLPFSLLPSEGIQNICTLILDIIASRTKKIKLLPTLRHCVPAARGITQTLKGSSLAALRAAMDVNSQPLASLQMIHHQLKTIGCL